MWRTLFGLMGIFATALLNSIDALSSERCSRRPRPHNQMTMLKDDGFKPKIITPNDIGSLFGDGSKNGNNAVLDGYSEDDEDDFDFEESVEKSETVEEIVVAAKPTAAVPTAQRYDSESNGMRELLALQKEMMSPPPPPPAVQQETEVEISAANYSRSEDDESSTDVDDYLNFDRVLDKVTHATQTSFFILLITEWPRMSSFPTYGID